MLCYAISILIFQNTLLRIGLSEFRSIFLTQVDRKLADLERLNYIGLESTIKQNIFIKRELHSVSFNDIITEKIYKIFSKIRNLEIKTVLYINEVSTKVVM